MRMHLCPQRACLYQIPVRSRPSWIRFMRVHLCPPMGVPLSTNPCAFEATLDSIHAYAFVSPTGTVISVHAARSVAVASCECPVTCYS